MPATSLAHAPAFGRGAGSGMGAAFTRTLTVAAAEVSAPSSAVYVKASCPAKPAPAV